MGRVRRLPLRRRQPFSAWKAGPQGRPRPPITGYWDILSNVQETETIAPIVGWDKGLTDDTALLTTTDKAALDITSDICLVACIRPDVIASGSYQRIFGKWGASGSFSYGLGLSPTGQIALHLSPNGTTLSNENSGVTAPLTNVLEDGEKFWIAGAIDSTNAATTGRDKKYWWRRDGDTTWTQLGVTQTNTPAQNIFSGGGDLSIGRLPGDTTLQFSGTIYEIKVYNGIGAFTAPEQGTLVAHAYMRGEWANDTYDDGLGNTWTRTDGTWKADPIYTLDISIGGLTGARFPHYANDSTVMVPDSGNDSLSLWSYANGINITELGTTGTQTQLDGARSAVVDATGAYAFVVSLESNRFSVYDIRQNSPQLVTSIQDATNLGGARAIIRVGNYCFVTCRDTARLTSVNVSDPTNPQIADSINHANLTDARGLVYYTTGSEETVYVAANSVNRVTAIDVSDPENLAYFTSLQDNTNLDGVHELILFEDTLICACVNTPGRVTKLSIGFPSPTLTFQSTYTFNTITQSMYSIDFDIQTGYVFVSNLDLGWVVMLDANGASFDHIFSVRPTGITSGGGVYIDQVKKLLTVVSFDEGAIALMKISGTT